MGRIAGIDLANQGVFGMLGFSIGTTNKTRMTSSIKTKFKVSGDQTNIAKYRLAATEYLIISKFILQRTTKLRFN